MSPMLLDQDAQYRARSSEAQTAAIDQTAGLVILTTEPWVRVSAGAGE
jgi:hypothetical protein